MQPHSRKIDKGKTRPPSKGRGEGRGGEVPAEVQSSWCCIDAETPRPARIGEHLLTFFFPKGE